MRSTHDHRGNSYWDVFDFLPGQINVSVTLPGKSRGYHMHKEKQDHILVVQGRFQLETSTDLEKSKMIEILEVGDTRTLESGTWHGYTNIGDEPAVLVYYETKKSGPDRNDDYEILMEQE